VNSKQKEKKKCFSKAKIVFAINPEKFAACWEIVNSLFTNFFVGTKSNFCFSDFPGTNLFLLHIPQK
jgi:hypothetical protein